MHNATVFWVSYSLGKHGVPHLRSVLPVSLPVTHEHLKDRALFSLPPHPPGANPTESYHLMASASQRSPYGDLLMQSGAAAAAAAAAAHLPDYISPVDGENNAVWCYCITTCSL